MNTTTAPAKFYQVELRPGGSHPTEYASMSIGEIALGFEAGRIPGVSFVTAGPGITSAITVDALLSLAKSGNLPQDQAENVLEPVAPRPVTEDSFKEVIADRREKGRKLSLTQQILNEANAELVALEGGADLSDTATVSRIAQLLAKREFAPRQVPLLAAACEDADIDLDFEANRFRRDVFAPKVREIEAALVDKIGKQIKVKFHDQSLFHQAIRNTATFVGWEEIVQDHLTMKAVESVSQAEALLDVWARVLGFEKEQFASAKNKIE